MTYNLTPHIHPLLKAKVGIALGVVLGSPKQNCTGLGICKIERATLQGQSSPFSDAACGKVAALGQIRNGRLVLYVLKYTISACTMKHHFEGDSFLVEDAYNIPDDIATLLDLPEGTQLCPGSYRTVDMGVHLCISIATTRVKRQKISKSIKPNSITVVLCLCNNLPIVSKKN